MKLETLTDADIKDYSIYLHQQALAEQDKQLAAKDAEILKLRGLLIAILDYYSSTSQISNDQLVLLSEIKEKDGR